MIQSVLRALTLSPLALLVWAYTLDATAEVRGVFKLVSITQIAPGQEKVCAPGKGEFTATIGLLDSGSRFSLNGHTGPSKKLSTRTIDREHILTFDPVISEAGHVTRFDLFDTTADCSYRFAFVQQGASAHRE